MTEDHRVTFVVIHGTYLSNKRDQCFFSYLLHIDEDLHRTVLVLSFPGVSGIVGYFNFFFQSLKYYSRIPYAFISFSTVCSFKYMLLTQPPLPSFLFGKLILGEF